MKRIRPISNQKLPAEKRQIDVRDENGSKTEPFLVPADYFDDLQRSIMDRIATDKLESQQNPKPSPLLKRVWMTTAALAAIALVIMLIKPMLPEGKSPVINTSEATLSDEYDQTYADEALSLEENTISDKDISTIDFKNMLISWNGSDTTSIPANDVIQYLLDENDGNDLIAGL